MHVFARSNMAVITSYCFLLSNTSSQTKPPIAWLRDDDITVINSRNRVINLPVFLLITSIEALSAFDFVFLFLNASPSTHGFSATAAAFALCCCLCRSECSFDAAPSSFIGVFTSAQSPFHTNSFDINRANGLRSRQQVSIFLLYGYGLH